MSPHFSYEGPGTHLRAIKHAAVLFLLHLVEELPDKGIVVSDPVDGWNYRLWTLGSLAFSTMSHRTK